MKKDQATRAIGLDDLRRGMADDLETTTTTLRSNDLIVEVGPGLRTWGIVLQTGSVMFDVLWLDGGSTTRFRHTWNREIRVATEEELRAERAYAGFDPIAHLRSEAAKVRGERRRGDGIRRGGGL